MDGTLSSDVGAWARVPDAVQAVRTRVTIATPDNGHFRLVRDYRAVKKRIEKPPRVVPIGEAEMVDSWGDACIAKPVMPYRYSHVPAAADDQGDSPRCDL